MAQAVLPCRTMEMQNLPPSGPPTQRARLLTALRSSRAMQKIRQYQTVLLAGTFFVLAAIFGLNSQSTIESPSGAASPTSLAQATLAPADGSITPTVATSTEVANLRPTPTDVAGVVGPPAPNRATPTNEGAYPPPVGQGPTSTVDPFPTLPVGGTTIPPFPTSSTGNRGTAAPTQSSGGYPTPSSNSATPAPTNIPVATDELPFPTEEGEDPKPTEDPFEETPSATEEPFETPTTTPTEGPTATPTNTPTPTPLPYDLIRGNTRWTLAQSPVRIRRDTIIAKGASLTIDDGVEVLLDANTSLVVDGTLTANAARFRKSGNSFWKSIVVNNGGQANLNWVDMRGGGSEGVLISALGGNTVIQDSVFEENKGRIYISGGNFDMQRSRVVGFAPISAEVRGGKSLRLFSNVINNTATDGATGVSLSATADDVEIVLEKNSFRGSSGTNVRAQFNQSLNAVFQCNSFSGGAYGLQIKSTDPTLDGSRILISGNSFQSHKNYGLTGDVGFDARNNWWGDASGPYHPEQNGAGTGDAVGVNLTFSPWLNAKPSCAP
ncbi:conserved hypothetical protein [Herpetosiphon aurantiacus DSM 785]|uniref:Right handed beta helix domain-containing protein n=2 Tax=Herpetosiphon TaxID=64 RepID=A9AUF0_HERA2|nr:conserved hypothetical protein [Herpetosiphon aurantiacus DSM 785]